MHLTAAHMLAGYRQGVFPMAESRASSEVFWVEPRLRGILPLDKFHISRSLRRAILREDYIIRTDTAFRDVVQACAAREETWINDSIFDAYCSLHELGQAHSLEVHDGSGLIGGVYGVTLGRCFFGESMFSRRRDASKIALAWLVDRLRAGGFALFDTQFLTTHLASLGAMEVSRTTYGKLLAAALVGRAAFHPPGYAPDAYSVIQRNSQTS